jgi:hypothetical protein
MGYDVSHSLNASGEEWVMHPSSERYEAERESRGGDFLGFLICFIIVLIIFILYLMTLG